MEVYTPIEFLKNKVAELKTIPGVEPSLIIEYEKAILILELIGSTALDEEDNAPQMNHLGSNLNNAPREEPKSYYERFMEAQKNKNSK